jgi:hypothetical protein
MINDDTFAEKPMLQNFLSLVARHKGSVAHRLQSGDFFTPLLLVNEEGVFRGRLGKWVCARDEPQTG